jgi:hypothetical protein
MAAKKFLSLVGGRIKELAGLVVSAGAGSDGALVALDASGKLDASVMPSGIGANTVSAIASENLAAGDAVNIYDNAGTATVRKADATVEGKEANGFVQSAFSSSAAATVYTSGNVITGLTGLTAGTRMFLHTTAGALTATPPSASGNVVQLVGIAASATTVMFEPEEPITLA